MKRIFCSILAFILLCGCSAGHEQPAFSPQTVLTETTQRGVPGFDPSLIMDTMTTEQLVGQLFLARCPSDESAVTDVADYHLGGYILFGRDFKDQTASSVNANIAAYQSAATIPLLIAVDEEGGTVTRVSSQPQFRNTRFPSPRQLYEEGGRDLLISTEKEKCQLLSSLGINVNMAPVCDITTDPSSFMYDRSLGLDPQQTGSCVAAMVDTMTQNRIGSVLKHFPGYGNNTDTHTGITVDNRPLSELEQADLIPFSYGIHAGCDAILISHTIVTCLDSNMPASLSAPVVDYLRETMGFDGVLVTDDLVMGAITGQYGSGEAAVLAVLAGNDLLCSSEYEIQYASVLEAVKNGRISTARIRQSVARILRWKNELGLIPANT